MSEWYSKETKLIGILIAAVSNTNSVLSMFGQYVYYHSSCGSQEQSFTACPLTMPFFVAPLIVWEVINQSVAPFSQRKVASVPEAKVGAGHFEGRLVLLLGPTSLLFNESEESVKISSSLLFNERAERESSSPAGFCPISEFCRQQSELLKDKPDNSDRNCISSDVSMWCIRR